jgi:predicted patatin/cPLA2 family phospholipase
VSSTPHGKIGVVLSGGGMRCAYTAGALVALVEKYNFTQPHAMAAESGSVGNMLYFLSAQYASGRAVWTEHLSDSKFISSLGMANIDYLIDTVFKVKVPFNTAALAACTTQYYFPITNVKNGETEFVTHTSPFDIFESMRAAKAIPIVYGKRVRLGSKTYVDGGLTATTSDLVTKISTTGVTTVLTINCRPPSRGLISRFFLSLLALVSPPPLRRAILKNITAPEILCPTAVGVRSICITPAQPLRMTTVSNSKRILTEAFDLGYADVAENQALQKLFTHENTD